MGVVRAGGLWWSDVWFCVGEPENADDTDLTRDLMVVYSGKFSQTASGMLLWDPSTSL